MPSLAALFASLLKAKEALANLRMNEENRIKLYEAARSFIGKDASPNDLAPDEYGCADSVSEVIKAAFGDYLIQKNRVSTYWLYKALRESPKWKEVHIPTPGCIVISPTGYGTRKNPDGTLAIPVGHVGIVMLNGRIASNDSRDGIFRENYSIESWRDRYVRRGGYFAKYYRPI